MTTKLEISAKIIAHSVNGTSTFNQKHIYTIQCVYPRFIHSEVMTHRVFSRNSMSSRAVPVEKMIKQVLENPAMPLRFMKNKPGMQSTEPLSDSEQIAAQQLWIEAGEEAVRVASHMLAMNIHKQFANRILEPFQWMHTIITATEWANFFELRKHPDAQPEFLELATQIGKAMESSMPVIRSATHANGSWHLPYIVDQEREYYNIETLRKMSAARCARVSYLNHDGTNPTIEQDVALYNRLVGSKPLHASPVEHQAKASTNPGEVSRNFIGWYQNRELVEAGK